MKKITQSKAFTFAEILIAVGIMVLLAGAALVGLSVNRNRQVLITTAEKAKSALEQVREFAEHPRSQDYRPLYYGVRFRQTVAEGFTATEVVIPDNNNDGLPDVTNLLAITDAAEEISIISLRPATLKNATLNVMLNGSWLPPIILTDDPNQPVWLGYRVGNPSQIIAYLPNNNIITNPGDIEEANAKFDFADPDTSNAYSDTAPGTRKYPVIYFQNEGAKIDIRMDY